MSAVNEAFTKGVLNALHKHKNREVCGCGYPMPVYPGRYPSSCPVCSTPRTTPNGDTGEEGSGDAAQS